jgi:hypothetical protein
MTPAPIIPPEVNDTMTDVVTNLSLVPDVKGILLVVFTEGDAVAVNAKGLLPVRKILLETLDVMLTAQGHPRE